jgi:CheY-like chemotaxis protein
MESIGMLAAGIVHDLNNMLAPIMLALGMIREQHSDPETLEHVQVMELAARRGAAVLRQVLTFARGVEGGRSKLDVGLLLKEVAQMARETFPREIRISLELAPDLRPADGILSQLHQVLLNLAVNARDAMPGGGVLTLHAENLMVDEARAARQITPAKPGVYVRMGIRDTGSGISPEVLEHMFEPFFSTKPRDKGTGLGLSTVFGIVRSHQGFIEVETEQGRGTDICVLLPATESGEVAAGSVPKVEARILGDGRRVLVVDDEAAIRQITCRILEKRGFRVTQATDGEEGLARFIAESAGFSAAILDLMMPKMDGYRLAEEIRRRAPSVPILCTTGMSNGSQFEKGAVLRLLGVHTLLSKPCTEAELLTALQRELG